MWLLLVSILQVASLCKKGAFFEIKQIYFGSELSNFSEHFTSNTLILHHTCHLWQLQLLELLQEQIISTTNPRDLIITPNQKFSNSFLIDWLLLAHNSTHVLIYIGEHYSCIFLFFELGLILSLFLCAYFNELRLTRCYLNSVTR